MGLYSPCVKKLRQDLVSYIENPTKEEFLKIEDSIPSYLLERCLTVMGDEFSNHNDKQIFAEKEENLIKEYELLKEELFQKIGENFSSQPTGQAYKVSGVIYRVILARQEDYALARDFMNNRGISTDR